MTGQGTETGRNALAGLPAVQSRRLHRNRLYRRGERTFSSLGRRTSATLQDDTAWHYTYNQRSEITSAIRKNASNVTQNNMRYVFDNIGNRTSSYEDATSKTYDANSLNQYTEIDVTGGSSVCPLYDDDGNMTQFDSSTYTYDAENRLVGAQSGTTRLEFIYDALGRRVARKLYLNNTLSKHHRYVYDGMKLLATYNAKSSFAKINSFLWQPFGLDVPLIMTYNSTVYGYLVDANKNVLGLFNPSKTRVATYLYGPFGQKLSESGTIAANNPLQFSSEQFDADLGLVYYNYRYYLPAIGKWLTKDPIGEMGGWNLYAFCRNDAINTWDENGNAKWKGGKRNGKERAVLILEKGDTIQTISLLVGLSSSQFKKWMDEESLSKTVSTKKHKSIEIRNLEENDPILCDGIEISVPNTIYMFDDIAFQVWWNQKQRKEMTVLKKQGFYVVEINDPIMENGDITKGNLHVITDYLRDKNIYGFAFWGHGAEGALIMDSDELKLEKLKKIISYKLGYVKLIACEAGQENWEECVSENGVYFACRQQLKIWHSWPFVVPMGVTRKHKIIDGW